MSVLKDPSFRAQLSKHGHDVGQTRKFSSTVGQLLPCYYDRLYPGDKVQLNTELISRTMDLETAAMCEINEQVDWFFVPMTQIYSMFDSWIYSVNDVSTSLVDPDSIQELFPYCPPSQFVSFFESLYDGADLTYGQMVNKASDQMRVPYVENLCRLWQLFGFGNHPLVFWRALQGEWDDDPQFQIDPDLGLVSIDLTLPAVYQKIYSDFYRLGDREANNPQNYSLDAYYDDPIIDNSTLRRLFMMRYRPMRRDMFTSAQTSPIFNDSDVNALLNANLVGVNQWLNRVSPAFSADYISDPTMEFRTSITDDENIVNTANINTIFAVNKLLEVTRRAGKHYDLQTLAHFGQEVPSGIAGEVMFLGSHKSKIAIGDVLATATNSDDDTYLGQVGGKGYGFGKGSNIEFKAPCHGVLMAIYSATPNVDYQPTMIDRLNTYLHTYDYWTPEFDKLGMQPLFRYQANTFAPDGAPTVTAEQNAEVIGWNYRYIESKTKIDVVNGAFTTSLDYWSASKNGPMNKDINNYLVPPDYLDRIMLLNFRPEATQSWIARSIFDRDPLIHMLRVDAKKVSAMSTYGVDNL